MGSENFTFKGCEPTWANACVGNNGNPQIIEYANGFAAAANLLIDQVIKDEGMKLHVDIFIYPICFNMRHAVELHLKGTIEKLAALAEYRQFKLPEFKLVSTHDISNAWEYIKINAVLLDKRYELQVKALENYITDIAEIDSTGQVFRYPFDTENRKHLVNVATINVLVLKQRFNKLEKLLSELNYLNIELIEEYACGSFTTKLSRQELFELASKLPKRRQWNSAEFAAAKSSLLTVYGLSSNDFCKALNIIQDNYEMSQFIDAVPALEAVTAPVLSAFFDGWIKLHDIEEVRNPKPICLDELGSEWPLDFSDHERRHAERNQWWREVGSIFSSKNMAELKALYYFGLDLRYSEHFKYSREMNIQEAIAEAGAHDPDQIQRHIYHILNKTDAMSEILNSLSFLGQTRLVLSLIDRYDLHACIDQILTRSTSKKRAPVTVTP